MESRDRNSGGDANLRSQLRAAVLEIGRLRADVARNRSPPPLPPASRTAAIAAGSDSDYAATEPRHLAAARYEIIVLKRELGRVRREAREEAERLRDALESGAAGRLAATAELEQLRSSISAATAECQSVITALRAALSVGSVISSAHLQLLSGAAAALHEAPNPTVSSFGDSWRYNGMADALLHQTRVQPAQRRPRSTSRSVSVGSGAATGLAQRRLAALASSLVDGENLLGTSVAPRTAASTIDTAAVSIGGGSSGLGSGSSVLAAAYAELTGENTRLRQRLDAAMAPQLPPFPQPQPAVEAELRVLVESTRASNEHLRHELATSLDRVALLEQGRSRTNLLLRGREGTAAVAADQSATVLRAAATVASASTQPDTSSAEVASEMPRQSLPFAAGRRPSGGNSGAGGGGEKPSIGSSSSSSISRRLPPISNSMGRMHLQPPQRRGSAGSSDGFFVGSMVSGSVAVAAAGPTVSVVRVVRDSLDSRDTVGDGGSSMHLVEEGTTPAPPMPVAAEGSRGVGGIDALAAAAAAPTTARSSLFRRDASHPAPADDDDEEDTHEVDISALLRRGRGRHRAAQQALWELRSAPREEDNEGIPHRPEPTLTSSSSTGHTPPRVNAGGNAATTQRGGKPSAVGRSSSAETHTARPPRAFPINAPPSSSSSSVYPSEWGARNAPTVLSSSTPADDAKTASAAAATLRSDLNTLDEEIAGMQASVARATSTVVEIRTALNTSGAAVTALNISGAAVTAGGSRTSAAAAAAAVTAAGGGRPGDIGYSSSWLLDISGGGTTTGDRHGSESTSAARTNARSSSVVSVDYSSTQQQQQQQQQQSASSSSTAWPRSSSIAHSSPSRSTSTYNHATAAVRGLGRWGNTEVLYIGGGGGDAYGGGDGDLPSSPLIEADGDTENGAGGGGSGGGMLAAQGFDISAVSDAIRAFVSRVASSSSSPVCSPAPPNRPNAPSPAAPPSDDANGVPGLPRYHYQPQQQDMPWHPSSREMPSSSLSAPLPFVPPTGGGETSFEAVSRGSRVPAASSSSGPGGENAGAVPPAHPHQQQQQREADYASGDEHHDALEEEEEATEEDTTPLSSLIERVRRYTEGRREDTFVVTGSSWLPPRRHDD